MNDKYSELNAWANANYEIAKNTVVKTPKAIESAKKLMLDAKKVLDDVNELIKESSDSAFKTRATGTTGYLNFIVSILGKKIQKFQDVNGAIEAKDKRLQSKREQNVQRVKVIEAEIKKRSVARAEMDKAAGK